MSAAARALKQTQPTLGRQVAALEDELGVTLFERSGRNLIPTPTALEIADHVRDMGEAATRLSLAASGQSQSVEGLVRITATEMYSAFVLPDFVAALREEHPGIIIDVVATNSLSDLRHREADIAVRNTEPTDPDLIARKLKTDGGGFFATPQLIAEHGPIEKLADLASVPMIAIGTWEQLLTGLQAKGVPVTEENFIVRTENHLVHWELVKKGLGFGLNGWDIGALEPSVRPVLRKALSFEYPIWLVAPRELKTNRRVRLVYDALAKHIKEFRASSDLAAF